MTLVQPSAAQLRAVEREFKALAFQPTGAKASGSATLGPLKIKYSVDGDRVKVEARAKIDGINKTIMSATLTPQRAKVSGSARTEVAKVKATLAARFTPGNGKLVGSVEVCHRRISRLRLKWKCKKVASATITSW
jgi:hypothetical protein